MTKVGPALQGLPFKKLKIQMSIEIARLAFVFIQILQI